MGNSKIKQWICVLLLVMSCSAMAFTQTLQEHAKQCHVSDKLSEHRKLVIDDEYLALMFDRYFSWSKVSKKYPVESDVLVSSRHDTSYKIKVMELGSTDDKFVFWSNKNRHSPLCFNVSSERLNTAELKLIGQPKAHYIQKYKLTESVDELEIGSVEGFIHIVIKFQNNSVSSVQFVERYFG